VNYQALDQFQLEFFFFFKEIPITNSLFYLIMIYFIIKLLFKPIFPKWRRVQHGRRIVFIMRKHIYKIRGVKLEILTRNNIFLLSIKLYEFVLSLVRQQIVKKGIKYFPIIFSLFLFILCSNLLGLALYSFTLTSHVTVAFTLSFSFFFAVIIIGLRIQKKKFINTFIPTAKISKYLLPFLVVIEIISYFSKPFSLGIRLFANMMSGHTLLIILAGFMLIILEKSMYIFLFPFLLLLAIIGLEIMIAILQTYVFSVLVCIYLNDSIVGAH